MALCKKHHYLRNKPVNLIHTTTIHIANLLYVSIDCCFRLFSGLVISVKDNLTLQMKLMYKKNKIQSEKISKLKADREQHQVCILTYYFCSQFVKIHVGIRRGIRVPSGKSQVVPLQIMVQAQPPHEAIGPLGRVSYDPL